MSSTESRTVSEASAPTTPIMKERPLSLVARSFSEQLNDVFLLDDTLDELTNQVEQKRFSLTTHNVELTALQARLKLAEELLEAKKKRLSLPAGASDEEVNEAEEKEKEAKEQEEKAKTEAESKLEPEPVVEVTAPPSPPPEPKPEPVVPLFRNPIGSDDEREGEESRTRRRLKRRMQNYSISSTDMYGMMGSYIPPNPVPMTTTTK